VDKEGDVVSTVEQQAVGADHHASQDMDAAVEAQMGKIMTELGGALGVLLTSLGTRSGLWAALAGAGPLTTDEVAAKVLVDPALVREWLRAQAAGGYLDYEPGRGTFQLPEAVAAAIHDGPGGALVDAAATMMSSMGERFGAFSEAFSTGRGFGWHQRTAEHWHGTDAFTRVALPTDLIAAAIDQLSDVASVLACGGSVVDVGCGYGTPTLGIAGLYPAATVLGIDYHDASIAHARAESSATGISNARFEVVAATELVGEWPSWWSGRWGSTSGSGSCSSARPTSSPQPTPPSPGPSTASNPRLECLGPRCGVARDRLVDILHRCPEFKRGTHGLVVQPANAPSRREMPRSRARR
jgi:hypothetical protein